MIRKTALLLLFIVCCMTARTQTAQGFVMGQFHTIDVREIACSLDGESSDAVSRIQTRRADPAPDDIRWIDRIYNLPDYMRTFYDNYGSSVNEVLEGGSNYLSDPDSDQKSVLQLAPGMTYLVLHQVKNKIEYTFPTDVDYNDPNAKQQYAVAAINNDVANYVTEVNVFIPYLFMSMSYDFPQAFWIGNSYQWGTSYSYYLDFIREPGRDFVEYTFYVLFAIKTYNFDFRIDRFASAEAVSNGVAEFKGRVDDILRGLPNTTRYDQVRYLNDWLTRNNAYSSAFSTGNFSQIVWSPMTALRGTNGADGPVCEGYARAFKILCDKIGIPCILAVGNAFASMGAAPESHMWNEIKMNDGNWYAVDVTWNDPVTTVQGTQPKESGAENENWLLLGKNDIVSPFLSFAQSHPNSQVYGAESSYWDFDSGSFIADTRFDIENGVSGSVQEMPVTIYSILGVNLGTFPSLRDAAASLPGGLYIANGRKIVIR